MKHVEEHGFGMVQTRDGSLKMVQNCIHKTPLLLVSLRSHSNQPTNPRGPALYFPSNFATRTGFTASGKQISNYSQLDREVCSVTRRSSALPVWHHDLLMSGSKKC